MWWCAGQLLTKIFKGKLLKLICKDQDILSVKREQKKVYNMPPYVKKRGKTLFLLACAF